MNALIRDTLLHALTEYDRCRVGKRGHNPYALPQYFQALDYVESDIKQGLTLRQALVQNYNDRLLAACLKAVGEPKATLKELR